MQLKITIRYKKEKIGEVTDLAVRWQEFVS